MRKIIALNGQSIFDIAILYCGTAEYAYDIALANGLDITWVSERDIELLIPREQNIIAKRFEEQNTSFATGYSEGKRGWILEGDIWNDLGVWMDNSSF